MKYIILNDGAFSSKRLRERLQSFAWADAKLCIGDCKALRWRLQSFASKMDKTGRKASVLFEIRGEKINHIGHCSFVGNFCRTQDSHIFVDIKSKWKGREHKIKKGFLVSRPGNHYKFLQINNEVIILSRAE